MKKKLFVAFLAVLTMAIAFSIAGCGGEKPDEGGKEENNYDQLRFVLSPNESHYTVYGVESANGVIEIPQTYAGKPVTEIGKDAFRSCSTLEKVSVPDSVTTISDGAFRGCVGIKDITLGGVQEIGEEAFYGCYNLKTVKLPSSLSRIKEDAFKECDSLTGVYISDLANWCGTQFYGELSNPLFYAKTLYLNSRKITNLVISDDVVKVTDYAFVNTQFTSITIANGAGEVSGKAFNMSAESVTAPASNLRIGFYFRAKTVVLTGGEVIEGSFGNCQYLESITIPDTIKKIDSLSFSSCIALKEVHISDVKSWLNIKFNDNPLKYASKLYVGDKLLTDLVVPDGVTSIPAAAFKSYTGLKSVKIGDGVRTIGSDAFYECSNLSKVEFGNNLTEIGMSAFYHCRALTSVTIPGSVQDIGYSAFGDCTYLASVTISDGVKEISGRAFSGCENLVSLSIGNGVSRIYGYAFGGCNNLKCLTLGKDVTQIDGEAFRCESLEKIYYRGTSEDWDKITCDSEGNSYFERAAKYFYSAEQPTSEGNYWRYVDGVVTEW